MLKAASAEADLDEVARVLRSIARLSRLQQVIDLREEDERVVVEVLAVLVGTEAFLLHGGNHERPLWDLAPRCAHERTRASGNQTAIYATSDWCQALLHALFFRSFVRSRLSSYAVCFRREGADVRISATKELQILIQENRRSCFRDGYIYLVRRSDFEPVHDCASEFVCPRAYAPVGCLYLSADLVDSVIGDELVSAPAAI